MDNPLDLLVNVWRDSNRFDRIDDSINHIAGILNSRMGIDGIIIRRIDPVKSAIETIASAAGSSGIQVNRTQAVSAKESLDVVMEWIPTGEIIPYSRGDERFLKFKDIIPGPLLNADCLLIPLQIIELTYGFILVYTQKHDFFRSVHYQVLSGMVEPISIAVRNDMRYREIHSLKEKAESDRDSLLVRFGRSEVGDVVIGADKGLKKTMDRVKLVAPSDLPVLIFGETGSGKEVVARAIHQLSDRSKKPFIRVNCGAIPNELIDSELFGHERGSFTGAYDSRPGWFERADNGTLFLDEVGELPLAAQVRLLQVLQDGTFERVGGKVQRVCNVRIIAATHRNLVEMIANGTFREDLWYRLSSFPIYLPALRERREDISELVNHFVKKASDRFGLPRRYPTDDEMEHLINYPWPGNVRELASVIDRATILGKGERLQVDVALGLHNVGSETPLSDSSNSIKFVDHTKFGTLDQMISDYITDVLRRCNGRVEGPFGAAEILKVNPHTLRSKMRKLGIGRSAAR